MEISKVKKIKRVETKHNLFFLNGLNIFIFKNELFDFN
tara:strand:- start:164 stop:277 length:114 start_codon:yes stop_codon:yes gene_type:complete